VEVAALAVTALAAGLACRAPRAARIAAGPVPAEGISIAIYATKERSYGVFDDRRTVEVTGRTILLDRIEPGALPTLLIEPLDPTGLRPAPRAKPVGSPPRESLSLIDPARGARAIALCARERIAVEPGPAAAGSGSPPSSPSRARATAEPASVTSPLVSCTVIGRPGRHLVRVHHVAASIAFRTGHEISLTAPDRATVSTRFAITTPAWGTRADVVLHDGAPGASAPPRELGRGSITLDGGTAVIALPPRDVPARLVYVYDGMTRGTLADRTDVNWGKDSHHEVRAILELDDPQLLPAPAHVRLPAGDGVHEIRTAYAPGEPSPADATASSAPTASSASSAATSAPRRLALWADPSLRGSRKRTVLRGDGATLADRLELSVANLGSEPRELWLEEPLRSARRRELLRARPSKPELAGDIARMKLVVAPGTRERLSFTVRYSF
jgi:hypothetical protein